MASSEQSSAARMRTEEEQGQRWLMVAYLLVLGLQAFAVFERLKLGNVGTVVGWLPYLGLQIGMMCVAWLGYRWARWVLFLLLLREALLSFQIALNFYNTGMVITFAVYVVALSLVALRDVGEFVRHQHRKHRLSASGDTRGFGEKAAFWSLLGPGLAIVMMLSGQPVPRDGHDLGPLLAVGAVMALMVGAILGIVGIVLANQKQLVGTLRAAVAGTCVCGMLGSFWIWAAARWPEQLERARMMAAQQTKHYLPIQTTVLQLEVVDRIKVELARMLNKSPRDFDTYKPIVAQGANDLHIVELVLALERVFQVKLPDGRLATKSGEGTSMLTIDQLAGVVAAEMKNKVSTAAYAPE